MLTLASEAAPTSQIWVHLAQNMRTDSLKGYVGGVGMQSSSALCMLLGNVTLATPSYPLFVVNAKNFDEPRKIVFG